MLRSLAGLAVLLLAAWAWLGRGDPAPLPAPPANASSPWMATGGQTAAAPRAVVVDETGATSPDRVDSRPEPPPLPPPGRIRGLVLGPDGAPLPRATVRCAGGASARTDRAGWFSLAGQRGDAPSVALSVFAAGHAPWHGAAIWDGPSEQISLRLAGMVALRVVDQQSGSPVQRFEAQLVAASPSELRAEPVILEGTDPGGQLESRVSVESPALLRVVAVDQGYAPSQLYLVELSEARPREIRVELSRWAERRLVVLDDASQPVAGAAVEVLVTPPGHACTLETPAVGAWRLHGLQVASQVSSATTEARGHATVRTPMRGPFTLRVSHADAGHFLDPDAAAQQPETAPRRVTLTR